MNLDKDWYRDVKGLLSSPQFTRFKKFLEDELDEQDIANRRNNDVSMYRGQGKAQFIAELLSAIDAAEKQP